MSKIYTVLDHMTGTSKTTGKEYHRFSYTYTRPDGFTEAGTDFIKFAVKKGDRVTPNYIRLDDGSFKVVGYDKA